MQRTKRPKCWTGFDQALKLKVFRLLFRETQAASFWLSEQHDDFPISQKLLEQFSSVIISFVFRPYCVDIFSRFIINTSEYIIIF